MRKIALCLAMLVLACSFTLGQTEKVLYSFGTNPNDGTQPPSTSSLTLDSHGNLFGITPYGGSLGGGTVFGLSPNSDGTWDETTLYDFCDSDSCPNGTRPQGALVLDSKGNLYGATAFGGAPCCGVVYELSPPSIPGGNWTQTVLHSFCQSSCADGAVPNASLLFDKLGNLYGSTQAGGPQNSGVVFELSPGPGGAWTETILYTFCQQSGCSDGAAPFQGVIFDKFGHLCGTTSGGGKNGYGVLFELSPGSSWNETVLYNFSAPPNTYLTVSFFGPLSIDPFGNIYTTATWLADNRGDYFPGDVYEFTTNGSVNIYPFRGANGSGPLSGVIVDKKRRVVYGTTSEAKQQRGDVFQLNAHGGEAVLYTFCHQTGCADGKVPGGLVEDKFGNLYGATELGGANNEGVVFEITP